MADITLRRVADLAALEAPWRALERRSATRFFQGWTWTGCLAAERFPDPVLLQAHVDGRLVGLALFNRTSARLMPAWIAPATLHLGESGDAARDALFIEHNGPLLETGHEALMAPCLAAALGSPLPGGPAGRRALALGGVGDAVLAAARTLTGAACRMRQSRGAPSVDFATLPAGGFLASLSASTRYQLRRSGRRYARLGALAVRRAADVDEGLAFLDALAALHQATWAARRQRGAFADPWFTRFYRQLVIRGLPRGEVDLLRIEAGGQAIGYLYNLLSTGPASPRWVGNYQSGFDYAAADSHMKSGLTCHHLAIEFYRDEGRSEYDFLAGESRYKASLANARTWLHWLDVTPKWTMQAMAQSCPATLHGVVSAVRANIPRRWSIKPEL